MKVADCCTHFNSFGYILNVDFFLDDVEIFRWDFVRLINFGFLGRRPKILWLNLKYGMLMLVKQAGNT